jgi:hypothetical protein
VTQPRGVASAASISIGGNVAGSAVVTGSDHRVTVTTGGTPEDVLSRLQEIRAALDSLTGVGGETARRDADAALAAAALPAPDKKKVGTALAGALEAARTTEEFAELAVRLTPTLHEAIGWLGDTWSHLSRLLA